jgi:hypothetical protein
MNLVINETMLCATSKELQRVGRINDPTAAVNQPNRERFERLPRQEFNHLIIKNRGNHRLEKSWFTATRGMDEKSSLVTGLIATLERPGPR